MTGIGCDQVPTSSELVAYRGLLRAHAKVTRCVEGALLSEQHLSLPAFQILAALAEAPRRSLRMTALAEAVQLSRSGVTRLVDRLERRQLVSRSKVDADGRGVSAALTDRGAERLRHATQTHLDGVVRCFVAALGEDCETLAKACDRLVDAGEACPVPQPPLP